MNGEFNPLRHHLLFSPDNIFKSCFFMISDFNRADPSEMPDTAASYLDLYCWSMYPFTGICQERVKQHEGDKNISIFHLSCRMSDLQFSLVLQTLVL